MEYYGSGNPAREWPHRIPSRTFTWAFIYGQPLAAAALALPEASIDLGGRLVRCSPIGVASKGV